MATPALHALLGASSSDRWMSCPGSIPLSKGMPNTPSVYAREGSCAHEVAKICLTENRDPFDMIGEEIPEYEEFDVNEEMADAVQIYIDAINHEIQLYHEAGFNDEEIVYECKFDLTHIYPDMFGTADCVIYFPEWKKLLVIDFKYGQGIAVEVEENPQLMYYGVGAATGKHNRLLEQIELMIVQPRCPHRAGPIRSWATTLDVLIDFISDLVKAAKRTEEKNPEFKTGDWCKFCPAAVKCSKLRDFCYETAVAEFTTGGEIMVEQPENLKPEQLALAWRNASILDGFVKSVKSYAHSQAIAGNLLPGTKLVKGRSRRRWKSEETAREKLESMREMGFFDDPIVTEKLKSPAQVETMLGKKSKTAIAGLWENGEAGLSLVPLDDDRPPAKVDAVEEFSQ